MMISATQLKQVIEQRTTDERSLLISQFLFEAINDWPTSNLTEPNEFIETIFYLHFIKFDLHVCNTMKTKLLFALFLTLSLITSAQRIDYALNHQEGGTFIQPNLLKVINDNLLLVSYSLTNNGIERKNMISIMDSEGRLLKSTTVNYVYEGDVIAIDILSNGYVAYLKRAFNKTCAIKARFYDVNLYLIKEISLYQGDSVNDVRFDCNNKKNATLVNGVTLRVGSINEVTRTVEMVNVVLDSLQIGRAHV